MSSTSFVESVETKSARSEKSSKSSRHEYLDDIAFAEPRRRYDFRFSIDPSNFIDPIASKKLNRKFDLRIIPWLFGIELLAFIDRSNIGNAKIVGLTEELKLTGLKFNVALVVFYIPYILANIPSSWLVKHVKGGFYLPTLVVLWGLTCTLTGFVKSFATLIVARLFLGLFEGGLLAGVLVYLSMFYRRHEILWRIGLFYCAAPLSGNTGGLLASFVAQIKYGNYIAWPWIFFVEGSITVLFGIACFFFLPHTPAEAKFLSEEERTLAMRRLKVDMHGAATCEDVNDEKFDWHWVRLAMLAPQTYLSSLAWFFLLIPLYSYALFLPSFVLVLGYSPTVAQYLTVPPNALAFILVLVTTTLSDKYRIRGPILAGGALVAGAGYVMLLLSRQNAVRYAGTFLVAAGVYPGFALMMGWLSNNLAPHYVRATGTGFMISFANCAAFIAGFIYLEKDAPNYVMGHAISLGALVLCVITCMTLIIYLLWENSARAQGLRDYRKEGDETRLGCFHPDFRYTL